MREIKFRGKSRRSGEWIYGSLVSPFEGNGAVIFRQGETDALRRGHEIYPGLISVDPDTVGQYTGLRDKNGREIYEGDVFSTDLSKPLVVEYLNGAFMVRCEENGNTYYDVFYPIDATPQQTIDLEIIGNIHDNPELMDNKWTKSWH